MNTRKIAADVICAVLEDGRSLTTALDHAKSALSSRRERAFLQTLCYGTLRWYYRLDLILNRLLDKPIRNKDLDIRVLGLLGLYQIAYTRVRPHAAVAETVSAAGRKYWAKSLLNAVLRTYLRGREEFDKAADQDDCGRTAHPQWLLKELGSSWPENVDTICAADNALPPMILRVNRKRCNRNEYLERLKAAEMEADPVEINPDAVWLIQPVDVEKIPGFRDGLVSVQDGAAQLAAYLLDARSGHRVLDACAAPGGKTAHILESDASFRELVAIDINPERAVRISETLARLGLEATILVGDLLDTTSWWDGNLFDRILLDAPCSATGVIRRHPDIKVLRRHADIQALAEAQQKMLESAWRMLAPGGRLVYSTCSVLTQENHEQIAIFMKKHNDAREILIEQPWGIQCIFGRQILPGDAGMDGFYYACLSRGQ